jgi:hypothetical protein
MTEKDRKKFEREIEIIEFYNLARKYGFCIPYCECKLCLK